MFQLKSVFAKLLVKLSLLLLFSAPAWAVTATPERILLTAQLLQERLDEPMQSGGFATVDLRNFTIDLTSENAEFRDRFYQQVRSKINRSKEPLGIDLSESLIAGELVASRLGLQMPLSQASLSSLLTTAEQEQLKRDERFLPQVTQPMPIVTVFRGPILLNAAQMTDSVNFEKTFFLQRLEASKASFAATNWSETRFGRTADWSDAVFNQDVDWSGSTFFDKARFTHAQFRGVANFRGSTFGAEATWSQALFRQANFTRALWLSRADFSQVSWGDRVLFSQSHFEQTLSFANATFEEAAAFRGTIFGASIDFQEVKLLDQVDFSNAIFAPNENLNVSGLAFDSEQAKIIGDTGVIGRIISLPILEGNETVLRNLVRNFRSLEQIPDANQIEYTTQRLRLKQLGNRLVGSFDDFQWSLISDSLYWLGLSLLLLLSDYGTSFGLVFGIGLVAIAYFGLLFWLIDRWRRRFPTPILPNRYETVCMLSSFTLLTLSGISIIFAQSGRPWLTLACAGLFFPVPLGLVARLYQQGRYHKLLDVTYFVEDGSMRQLRLLIVRLPIMPRFPFFRERYEPILWERRWNWLNYYDLSVNNLLKLGFNDIRLRDQHLPGIVSTLVWYQWSLGILYVALLLWTISRTIPGLNVLIYLK